jgi:dolichyl-phosphate beta-glucosyltransferase
MLLTYVLPVHNEAAILADNVARLRGELSRHPGSRILLVENGSHDGSAAVAKGLEGVAESVSVHAFSLPTAGIGHAYHRGLHEALVMDGADPSRHVVLTAADLPFSFTDLEQALPHLTDATAPILIGSKAHPQSTVHVSSERAIATRVYRGLRRTVAGMRTGDSQGSIFLRMDVVDRLVDLVVSRDFFYSTELVFHAERLGIPIIELPVTVAPEVRASTVRPLRHGSAMMMALLRTVRRWGRIRW